MGEIIQLDSIKTYNELYGLPTVHPLVTVVDLRKARHMVNHAKMHYGVYALFIKHGIGCTLRYGRQNYDYQEGTVVSFAPGQLVQVDYETEELSKDVCGLIFHPDLIFGTSLAEKMSKYTFFSYAQSEALHMSEKEQIILVDLLQHIQEEMEYPIDKHSRDLLCAYIELFLDYCLRFYDRQFLTRCKVNSDILQRFEHLLHNYFESGKAIRLGLPSVAYFADKICLSANYFGDLIKKETGRTAQEHIQLKLLDEAKKQLLGSTLGINQIAERLGYQDTQHFIRMFKKRTGRTPLKFRVENNG